MKRVAIVAGIRTPFVKAGKDFSELGPLKLGIHTVRGLLEKTKIDPGMIEAIAFGVVVPEPGKPNLAREIVFETGLPSSIEAQTIASYCITGLRTLSAMADAIALGRMEVGIAGGVDSFSHADMDIFVEPSTGLSMGQHMEITAKEWNISREDQDKIALASHENAVKAREKLSREISPLLGLSHDTGPRSDTSLTALAGLNPVFDQSGTLTAGNSSPVTDGAAALLLMSEERARSSGLEILAFVKSFEFGAIDPKDGLLMAPCVTVPRILEKNSLTLGDIDLVEIHEAFGAQVLANIMALEKGFMGKPTGPFDMHRVNVSGSSIAIGHPWSATGGRIVTTLAYEMARREVSLGLVSICAAGAMAGAVLLERK
jgi:acetyl-CoA acetyltransferase family protein